MYHTFTVIYRTILQATDTPNKVWKKTLSANAKREEVIKRFRREHPTAEIVDIF